METKVSIIIPTYNGEKYIKETIESCLNQTYLNIEIIVIDDCSSDNTVNLLKEYGEKTRLYLNEENQGISKNVNKGVGLSEGEYFILLGHDDILPNNHVETMLSEFDSDTIAIHCNSIIIDHNGNKKNSTRDDQLQLRKTANCIFELSIDNFISSCGMVHKSDVFKKIGGWDETYKQYGEWLYYIKELQHGKIKYTTKTKAFYRRHETNITNTFRNKGVKKSLVNFKKTCRRMAHKLNDNTLLENFKFYANDLKLMIKSLK